MDPDYDDDGSPKFESEAERFATWARLNPIGTPDCPCWDEAGCQTPFECSITEADYDTEEIA